MSVGIWEKKSHILIVCGYYVDYVVLILCSYDMYN